MTNGNIHQVLREMGHTNIQTKMEYLRFTEQRRLDDFPSLKEEVEQSQNVLKYGIRDTLIRDTVPHLLPLNREEMN